MIVYPNPSKFCCRRPVEPVTDEVFEKQEGEKTAPHTESKPKSWRNSVIPDINNTTNITYTYEECAFIFDRFNFVSFLIFQAILTVSFFSAIVVGGANSLE